MPLRGKKILQILPELNAGGVERTTLEITEALIQAGAEAHIVSGGGRLEGAIADAGGRLYRLPLATKNPMTMWKNKAALIKLIESKDIDLIHARSRAPAWSALGAARASDTPFVTTYHGAYSGRIWPKVFYNSVMARGDIVIANSKFIANHIRATHKTPDARMVTIPRGVDMAIFDPDKIAPDRLKAMEAHFGKTPNTTLFVLPARLTSWKGQRQTVLAIASLPPEIRQSIRCILAGDPQGRRHYVTALESTIQRAGLQDIVKIVPHITDMPAALMAADWVLAPSQRPEAFGRVAAEGSAMAKPVITTAIGGGLETIINHRTGMHVPPKDTIALAEAIRFAAALPNDKRAALGAQGRQHILTLFTKTMLQHKTLGVYERLLPQQKA